jgi:hypothetical protein
MGDLNYLLFMDFHPSLKKLVKIGNTAIEYSEIMHDSFTKLGL